MGTDILAWIEVALEILPDEWQWITLVDAALLFDRDYDVFGCLFGVRNYANFRPLASDRGIPADASTSVIEVLQDEAVYGATWISLPELLAVDWEEETLYPDGRLHEYCYGEDGALMASFKKYGGSSEIEKITGLTLQEMQSPTHHWEDNQEWKGEGKIFRAERLKRKEVLEGSLQLVLDIMRRLGDRFGAEHVRLVVGFYD